MATSDPGAQEVVVKPITDDLDPPLNQDELDELAKRETVESELEDESTPPAEEGKEDQPAEAGDEDKVAADEAALQRQQKEQNALLAITRRQRHELALMQEKIASLEKKLSTPPPTKKTLDSLDDLDLESDESRQKSVEKEPEPEPTVLETLHGHLQHIGETKGPVLDTLLETMKLTPEYKDVEEVVTRGRLDYLVDQVADSISREYNISFEEAALRTEIQIWNQRNPYAYLHKLIKTYHPDYASQRAKEETPTVPGATKKITPVKAPTSIQAAPSGASNEQKWAGWSAKRIDDMPEEDLHKVPKDVYEAYLQGELDT